MKYSNAAVLSLAVVSTSSSTANATCPYAKQGAKPGNLRIPNGHPGAKLRQLEESTTTEVLTPPVDNVDVLSETRPRSGDHGVPEGGFEAVKQAIIPLLTDSQEFWPSDFGNYGPFFVRLAWHCSGSFRNYDGRGGCDGGRIRFDPELNWEDNANLDKALQLLQPIKDQFGSSLSWGDLIILAGTTAIESMGGPTIGFCGGRVDDANGRASLIQSPSSDNCINGEVARNGQCVIGVPIAPSHAGLIYVDPAGPEDPDTLEPSVDPAASGPDIRKVFAKMGLDSRQSVALIGGGHAFGKAHGACENPPCGEGDMQGKGNNTFSSGFEGQWTSAPTTWTNMFFTNLFDNEWSVITGPGGHPQLAHSDDPTKGFMFTTDLALRFDEEFQPISEEYANDINVLNNDFGPAWYQLTTGDMGPATRCIGDLVPPVQPFQHALPQAPTTKPDYVPIRAAVQTLIDEDASKIAAFSKLAKDCASTFRQTDYRGGCNGARIRFSPESEWETNAGDADALATLQSVKDQFPAISYADLIVLAGQTALEQAGATPMAFCGGRVDAEDGSGSENLESRVYFPASLTVQDDMVVKGLTKPEGVALFATPMVAGSSKLSNQYFVDLKNGDGSFSDEELTLLQEPFVEVVDEFIANNQVFLDAYQSAWTYMMTADRFDGPINNVCTNVNDATLADTSDEPTQAPTSPSSANRVSAVVAAAFLAVGASVMLI